MKKCLISLITSVIFIFVTDFLIHQVIMKDIYMSTAQLWRSPEEMQGLMMYMVLGQILVGAALGMIFAKGYHGHGLKEGLRFGALFGALNVGHCMIMHVVSPYPTALTMGWAISGFVQFVVLGLVLAKIWGKEVACCTTGCETK